MRVALRALFLLACPLLCASPSSAHTRTAADFPGPSIIEQLQAALKDCGNNPCDITIPAGTYAASPISTWKNKDTTGSALGVPIPSNVEIKGAGRGRTIIQVTRKATDPPATLFANANPSNRNIHLSDMSIIWTDEAKTYDWVSIFICHHCDQLELDHLSLEGNPNKLVNLLDSTGSSVHDNLFMIHSTGYGKGDNALSVSRFDATPLGPAAGVIRDNQFSVTGDERLLSMLVIAQSGLDVHSNVFEAHFPPPGNATAIEMGQDNLLRLPENVKISNNIFHDCSIAHGGMNDSEITNNFFDHGDIYIALQDGTIASLAGLTIADNEVHFGDIGINGLEHTSTSRLVITRNRVFDGGIGTGGSSLIQDVEVSYNLVRYSPNHSGIECNACSIIRGNVVREIGQNAPGNLQAGYAIGGKVQDVSNNLYLDEQHEYSAGTICSIAKPTSKPCMARGSSPWILLQGGDWGFGWTNRTLFTEHGNFLIHAFLNNSVLELEENAPLIPANSPYHLYRTTFNAFELNGATIGRFANNMAAATEGLKHAAIQEDGTVTIRNLYGNVFHPYSCFGKCAVDYRATVNAPE